MINDSLFSTGKNDWATPQDLFDELDAEFCFTLDPCSSSENTKCLRHYTEADDGLKQDWSGETVFCNPPYSSSQQTEWVQKCYEHGKRGGTAVMLIPARTDTRRFHDYILKDAEIRFIRGRLKFGDSVNSAPFPSMVIIFGPRAKKGCDVIKNNNFRPPESFLPGTDSTLVLVDWSNLMYRAWFVSKEEPWVAFCKFFDMLRLCIHKSKEPGVPIKVIFAGESKTKLKRTELFPEYKGTRKHSKNPEFAKFRKELENYIEKLGYELIRVDGAEADDVIASIVASTCHRCYCKVPCGNCEHAQQYTTDVVIFSGDRDLQQLLAWKRVLIYRAPGLFVDVAAFEEEHGIPVAKYGIYKALVGDASDNILGVEGFGPVKAKLAINSNTVAEDIWELGERKAAEQFKLALNLVNLDTKIDIDLDNIYAGAPKIEEKELSTHLDKRILLEINRFKEEFDT